MATPIVKANRGKESKVFYSQYEYEQWREAEGRVGWKVKYYKGLGTSTRDEAKDYFTKVNAVKFDYTVDVNKFPDATKKALQTLHVQACASDMPTFENAVSELMAKNVSQYQVILNMKPN